MSTGFGWEGLRQVCATLIGARHVPERLCGGSVYLGRYNKCSTFRSRRSASVITSPSYIRSAQFVGRLQWLKYAHSQSWWLYTNRKSDRRRDWCDSDELLAVRSNSKLFQQQQQQCVEYERIVGWLLSTVVNDLSEHAARSDGVSSSSSSWCSNVSNLSLLWARRRSLYTDMLLLLLLVDASYRWQQIACTLMTITCTCSVWYLIAFSLYSSCVSRRLTSLSLADSHLLTINCRTCD